MCQIALGKSPAVVANKGCAVAGIGLSTLSANRDAGRVCYVMVECYQCMCSASYIHSCVRYENRRLCRTTSDNLCVNDVIPIQINGCVM